MEQGDESAAGRPDRARESASVFESRSCDTSDELRGLSQLLDSSHEYEDEAEALTRAAASIRQHTGALGVGIFGCAGAVTHLFASSGPHDRIIARRAFDAGLTIGPESTGGWVSVAVPMRYLGRFIGALSLRWTSEGPASVDRASAFASAATAACAPLVYVLQERQGVVCPDTASSDLIGVSSAIGEVMRAVGRAANAPFTVLIEGESGAGKELVARAIHRSGCRRDRAFCALNCAAMPEDLIDAELFGHARGAFTGAANERLGLFESADGGSLFLDEVGELSPRAQAKLLRALQEGEIRRIGETLTRSFDTRLIAATNRSLRAEVEAGRFRQDLLYRLDVIRIHVPPLRQRLEDIPLLAARFWGEATARIDSRAVLGKSALSALTRYDWPGNVRELQNVLTALVVAAPRRGVVGDSALPSAIARATPPETSESLESARQKFEQRFVRAALARAAGHRGRTAAALGVSRQGLAKLMERLQLDA
jgi:transcriptional regulator with GAF, ATPase, and Fis domain